MFVRQAWKKQLHTAWCDNILVVVPLNNPVYCCSPILQLWQWPRWRNCKELCPSCLVPGYMGTTPILDIPVQACTELHTCCPQNTARIKTYDYIAERDEAWSASKLQRGANVQTMQPYGMYISLYDLVQPKPYYFWVEGLSTWLSSFIKGLSLIYQLRILTSSDLTWKIFSCKRVVPKL